MTTIDQPVFEKLCRDAAIADNRNPDECILGTGRTRADGTSYTECHRRMWQEYAPLVRTVLEALKEPSKEMQDAGNEIINSESWPLAKDVFYFMIQAILDEAER